LQIYYSRNRLLDSVKILTTTQLYMLYNLCVISRYKTQTCIVALRILKCCSKCFLAHNSNNPKKIFCKLFFFSKNMLDETAPYRIFRSYINTHLYISKLRKSCRAYQVMLTLQFWGRIIINCVGGRPIKWNFGCVFASQMDVTFFLAVQKLAWHDRMIIVRVRRLILLSAAL